MRTTALGFAVTILALLAGCSDSGTPPSTETGVSPAPLTTPGLFFQGNNFSGAERGFGASIEESWGPAIPGVEDQTYWWPDPAEDEVPAGMNTVRLPFQWERLQPTLNGDFDASYLARFHETANAWRDHGFNVLLDVHNYAHYKVDGRGTEQPGQLIGSVEVPVAAFADFWRRMAVEFGSESTSSPFIFGLMNEPHDIAVSVWVDAAQQAVTAIRDAGARNPVFVPGADWSTASDFSWSQNADLLQSVTDPLDNMAIEVHQYYDGTCSPNSYVDLLASFEQWAVANDRVAFLGETDLTDESAACREAFANLIDHLHATPAGASGGVWIGFTYWEGTNVSAVLPEIQDHLPSTCTNGARDGSETDVDCGSTCLRCVAGSACTQDYDCQSGFCAGELCAEAPTAGGTGGAGGSGTGGATTTGGAVSTGGVLATGGATTMGGEVTTGGASTTGGATTTGGAATIGGMVTTGGMMPGGGMTTTTGGMATSGGAVANGSTMTTGGTAAATRGADTTSDSGCGCRLGNRPKSPTWATLFLALGLVRRRRKHSAEPAPRH